MAEDPALAKTPLYSAQNASRYERQDEVSKYEVVYNCRLIVLVDAIFPYGITLLEELLVDADPTRDLHLILYSPGGDGETAVRILRSLHARTKKLSVIVPDQAKSAATLIALGAHEIIMGPTSDLGPIDPQMQPPNKPNTLVAAKDIIAAVEDAATKVHQAPETYPLYAALLSDVTALLLQQARAALGRSDDLLRLSLETCTGRSPTQITDLFNKLKPVLIAGAKTHAAIFGASEARATGLPVKELTSSDPQWQEIWKLWTKYYNLRSKVYESNRASQVFPWIESPA
jgi:hypothetical protein